jgi:TatD DNase family protein
MEIYPFLIDTHAHLHFPPLLSRVPDILKAAEREHIHYVIDPGDSLPGSRRAIELAEQYPQIFAAAGIHPHEAHKLPTDFLFQLKKLLHHPRIVAVGEIGLDYVKSDASPQHQRQLLGAQVRLGLEYGLPLIIHCRGAFDDLYKILSRESKHINGVLHCYSGTPETAQRFLDLGMMISFTGVVTFPQAERAQVSATRIPLDRLMLETDSPFLAPQPVRGKISEPVYVKFVAEKIAELKNMSIRDLVQETTKNAVHFFRLKDKIEQQAQAQALLPL